MSKTKIERCGYCGTYIIDGVDADSDMLKKTTPKQLKNYTLGYCSNAQDEHQEQNPEENNAPLGHSVDVNGYCNMGCC